MEKIWCPRQELQEINVLCGVERRQSVWLYRSKNKHSGTTIDGRRRAAMGIPMMGLILLFLPQTSSRLGQFQRPGILKKRHYEKSNEKKRKEKKQETFQWRLMRWGQWRRIKMIIMMMFTTTRCPLITMWRQTVGSCFPTFNHYKMAFCADTKVQSVPTCFCVLAFLSLSFLRHWGWWMLVPRISKCSIEWQFFILFPKQITKQQLKNSSLLLFRSLCLSTAIGTGKQLH